MYLDISELSLRAFDFDYKKAIHYLYEHPEAKVFVQDGIYPYIARPLAPGEPPPRFDLIPGFIIKSIWPISFARMISLDILTECEEIDPDGNGKKLHYFYRLNRIAAKGLLKKKIGRPKQAVEAEETIALMMDTLQEIEAGRMNMEQVRLAIRKGKEWEQLAP